MARRSFPCTQVVLMMMAAVFFCAKCNDASHSASTTGGSIRKSPPTPQNHAAAADRPVCLDRLATATFVSMAAHPDGSNRIFMSTQDGKIWLGSVPVGGGTLSANGGGASPFLDLTDRVYELRDVQFHSQFATNNRFFVSYTCDSASPACGVGNCSGSKPCQYQLVVDDFTVKAATGSEAGAAADSFQVKRLFTMGLPQQPHTPNSYQQQGGGQILFRDGHLYLITGNGGDNDERSLLGKIIRFDIGGTAGGIIEPEIVAMGVGNPRGCSYDSEKPSSYFYCAGVDQQQNEQVYLISDDKLGRDNGSSSLAHNRVLIVNHRRPVAGGTPSIIGGFVYHGSTDPTLNGRYLYMYGFALWTAVEGSSGHYASRPIPSIMCSRNTPVPCTGGIGSRVLSLGEDNSKDVFILATDGVYRVVSHGLCGGGAPPAPPLSPLLMLPSKKWSGWKVAIVAIASVLGLGSAGALKFYCCNGWNFRRT